MKRNLGKHLAILLLVINMEIFASSYTWNASINKQTVYVDEAVHLKYVCSFNDSAELYSIDFNPAGEYENYSIKILTEDEKLIDSKKVFSYEFVAFTKKAGELDFPFKPVMKKTNVESIENTILGRDNSDYEEYSSNIENIKVLKLSVNDIKTKLIGDFELIVKKDTQEIKAYEPYHLSISISGIGSFKYIKNINYEIDGVKIFAQKPMTSIELTKEGYKGYWNQKFAFTSDKDFVIPEINIEYFDIKSKSVKYLKVKQTKVKVNKSFKKEELLDVEDDKLTFNVSYIYYLLTFIAGFLVAKIKFLKPKKLSRISEEELFINKIKEIESIDKLIIILALQDSNKYEKIILDIETKKVTSLSKVKKELLDLI